MKEVKRIRIVVGYPSDAATGRQILSEIVQQSQFKTLESEFACDLELVAWDTHSSPGIHTDGAQGWIDLSLKIEECDLFVAMFFQKLGTPYAKGNPPQQFESGTAYELETAIGNWEQNKQPQVWLCLPNEFTDNLGSVLDPSPELVQYVNKIKGVHNRYGLLYLPYSSWIQLAQSLSDALFKFVIATLNRGPETGRSKKQATLFYGAHARSIAVPAEAITAPVDDIEITLAIDSDNPGEIHWQGRLVIYLNTNLTSPIEDGFSTAKLTVLETELGTGQRVKVSKVFGGQRGANSVSFEVAVKFSQSPLDARLLISDLFANANQLGISLAGPTYIVAFVALVSSETDRFDLRAGNVQCQVGMLRPVLNIRRLSPVEQRHPPTLPAPDEGTKFRRGSFEVAVAGLPEKTLTAFVSRNRVITRTSFQNGLRVMFRVSGLQEGQELWMLAVVPADILGYTWRYLDADANGGGQLKEPRSAVRSLGLESFRVAPHSEGYSYSVYELYADADAPTSYSPQMGSFEFLVCQASTSTMQKSQLIMSCCFAPLSPETTASTSAYLPRFADTSSQRAITFEWS